MSDNFPSMTIHKPLIGITIGDPLGVGPEVVVKALADASLRSRARFLIFGAQDPLEFAADLAEITPYWWREPFDQVGDVRTGVLLADFDDLPPMRVGPNDAHEADANAGRASFRFLDEALRLAAAGRIDAIVTGPICKESWVMAGHKYAGHTELLAYRFGERRVTMSFIADDLRVALASDHVPLFDLRNRFTIGLVHQPIDLLHQALRDDFGIASPHIGVLGLNPHAGEGGLLGDEEQRIIEPAIAIARSRDIRVSGPIPADTAFIPDALKKYDGIVAMYHDQGLIPVKMLAFDRAVNLTLGLPIVRTSPDHGTAFDIAGRNRARPGSMRAAISLAIDLAERRRAASGEYRLANSG
ncbi:MAG: 4-hydroxythreonine-4-phosphate dehydrogenase PdxA [Phycisphaerae bacterium]|nr:4-hydroxythreonine-4-phosphate dehydrogenase PdxA [Phycisphaerae bacterium]